MIYIIGGLIAFVAAATWFSIDMEEDESMLKPVLCALFIGIAWPVMTGIVIGVILHDWDERAANHENNGKIHLNPNKEE